MDPVSQGVLGAVFAQSRGKLADLGKAAIIGGISAMTPDLDIFIRSSTDPLLFLEYHRQFTHSLFFIPIGGLICSFIFYLLLAKRWDLRFLQILSWSTIGYATHGLLDGCTSYGTQLLWPFTNQRFTWDIISIVDPLFTLPLLVFSILAVKTGSRPYAIFAVCWVVTYLLIGFVQHQRAEAKGYQIAQERGHAVRRLNVKPSFGNLALWKVIYDSGDRYYVDAVKPGLAETRFWPGQSIKKLDLARDLPWLPVDSQQARDIERFRWFSSSFLAQDPENPLRVVDMRYSLLPQNIEPLWGIELSARASAYEHAKFYSERKNKEASFKQLIQMIF